MSSEKTIVLKDFTRRDGFIGVYTATNVPEKIKQADT